LHSEYRESVLATTAKARTVRACPANRFKK
jgi:hypothetical protein